MDFKEYSRTQNDHRYRAPEDLAVSRPELGRGLVIGSCFSEWLAGTFNAHGQSVDHILYNNVAVLPKLTAEKAREYGYQIIILGLRNITHETPYIHIQPGNETAYKKYFDESVARLRQFLVGAMQYNKEHHLPAFVSNFMVPQQNQIGRLLPRYRFGNFVYFVEQLNESLAQELEEYQDAYLLDMDAIASSFGKKHISDDSVWISTHRTELTDTDYVVDQNRITKPFHITEYYDLRTPEFRLAIQHEFLAAYRTLLQLDQVKLIAIDLDDTLWRGVVAEEGFGAKPPKDAWPVGFAEALLNFKKRGGLLAIISKNDEAKIISLWDQIYEGFIHLDDFAIRKINWRPKTENMEEVLKEANLLPGSVVFVDDNPVERAAMQAHFPEMRILGEHPYYLRRIVLWSPETQVRAITGESAKRTQMVRAQILREQTRKVMSRDEFLATLGLKVNVEIIASERDSDFPRAFELLNKTNQFNTTGARWRKEDLLDGFAQGMAIYTFDATDKFTSYEIVGLAIVVQNRIKQFVMSCRVVGLDIEYAVLPIIEGCIALAGHPQVQADFVETPANKLCHELYQRAGYQLTNGFWTKSTQAAPSAPAHIKISVENRNNRPR